MVWFWLLGLSASVLAGREAGLPQQLPGPGATLNPEHQDQKAHIAFREVHFPCWMVCKSSKLINSSEQVREQTIYMVTKKMLHNY